MTNEVDDSYEIDVDEPFFDDPAVLPVAQVPVIAESTRVKRVWPQDEPKPAKEPKAPKPPKVAKPPRVRTDDSNRRWSAAAAVIGAMGLLVSVVLAIGALFSALDAAQGSVFFGHLSDVCDALVGPLEDVFGFSGVNAEKKQALVGWGLGSMGYLLLGRFSQSVLLSRIKD